MYKLFYLPDTASLAPHIVLQRLGAAHELIKMGKNDGSLQSEDYLKLNPNQRVPTLIDGDMVLFESAAICLHLADSDPDLGLMPPLGSAERASAYQWLIFLTNSVQADIMLYFYKERFAKSEQAIEEVRLTGIERVTTLMQRIDDTLSDGRAHLSGTPKTIVDDYLLMLGRWFVQMGQEEALKSMAHLHALLCVLEDDVHVKAAYEAEGCQALFMA